MTSKYHQIKCYVLAVEDGDASEDFALDNIRRILKEEAPVQQTTSRYATALEEIVECYESMRPNENRDVAMYTLARERLNGLLKSNGEKQPTA